MTISRRAFGLGAGGMTLAAFLAACSDTGGGGDGSTGGGGSGNGGGG